MEKLDSEIKRLDSEMKRLDLKIQTAVESKNFCLGPTKWEKTGKMRYTLNT